LKSATDLSIGEAYGNRQVQESKLGGESRQLVQQESVTSSPFISMPQRRQQSPSFGSVHPHSLQILWSESVFFPYTMQVVGRVQRIDCFSS
tara:strand:- start:347 stop:619 length:273 start_codon:yes stop_codon:yes gene_type:complete